MSRHYAPGSGSSRGTIGFPPDGDRSIYIAGRLNTDLIDEAYESPHVSKDSPQSVVEDTLAEGRRKSPGAERVVDQSEKGTEGNSRPPSEATNRSKKTRRHSDTFLGWNHSDAGTSSMSYYDDMLPVKEKANEVEVYEGFGNREDILERRASASMPDEEVKMADEEYDARRPWIRAPIDQGSRSNNAVSANASLMSFDMDGTNADITKKSRRSLDLEDNVDSIGARRMSRDSVDFDSRVGKETDYVGDTSSEALSEFAYAQLVLQRNEIKVDSRPTRTELLRKARDSDSDDERGATKLSEDSARVGSIVDDEEKEGKPNAQIKGLGFRAVKGLVESIRSSASKQKYESVADGKGGGALDEESISNVIISGESEAKVELNHSARKSSQTADLSQNVSVRARSRDQEDAKDEDDTDRTRSLLQKKKIRTHSRDQEDAKDEGDTDRTRSLLQKKKIRTHSRDQDDVKDESNVKRTESLPQNETVRTRSNDQEDMKEEDHLDKTEILAQDENLRARSYDQEEAEDEFDEERIYTHETESRRRGTFEYWNDGYGELDRSVKSRSIVIPHKRVGGGRGVSASNPTTERRERDKRQQQPDAFDDIEAARQHRTGDRGLRSEKDLDTLKQVHRPSNKLKARRDLSSLKRSNWDHWQEDSDRSVEVEAILDGFQSSRKQKVKLETIVGPQLWQKRRILYIVLGALLVLVIFISVGVVVGKRNKQDSAETRFDDEGFGDIIDPILLGLDPNPPGSPPSYRSFQKIEGSNTLDHAGSSVSYSSLGSYVSVGFKQDKDGSNSSGLVRVYRLVNGSYKQVGEDIVGIADGDEFGYSTSLSNNGQRVAIGARSNDNEGESSGLVLVFEYSSKSGWERLGSKITGMGSQDRAGFSVALSGDGKRVAVGAPRGGNETGSARVFAQDSSGEWIKVGQEIVGNETAELGGYDVSLSFRGDVLAVSFPRSSTNELTKNGSVAIFASNRIGSDSNWKIIGEEIMGEDSGDQNGESIALSGDGYTIVIGANGRDAASFKNAGYCRIFHLDGMNEWKQEGSSIYGRAQGEQMGYSVAISSDASTVACGGPNSRENGERSGGVRVFQKTLDEEWSELGSKLSSSAFSAFGSSLSLSLDGTFLAVGAPESDRRAGFVELYTTL